MLLKYFMLIVGTITLLYVYNAYTSIETFTNYGCVNSPLANYLLADSYPIKSKSELTEETYRDSSLKNPLNNNKRYWDTPDNGSCLLNELCGNMYDKKNIDKFQFIPASLNSRLRINYYLQ